MQEPRSSRVKVVVRVRPPIDKEKQQDNCLKMDENKVCLFNQNREVVSSYEVDHYFGSFYTASQAIKDPILAQKPSFYQVTVKKLFQKILNDENGCIIAYGQKKSGKTYSMIGTRQHKGIVLKIFQFLFDKFPHIKNQASKVQIIIKLSIVELFNEKMKDLLEKDSILGKLSLKQDKDKYYIQGCKQAICYDQQTFQTELNQAIQNKGYKKGEGDKKQNKAHTIISIKLIKKIIINDKNMQTESVLHLVDLSGNQKPKQLQKVQKTNIYKSIQTLRQVIIELNKQKSKQSISFKDSILTKILKNSLGGNSNTLILLTISPGFQNFQQTKYTLQFGQYAHQIYNTIIKNKPKASLLIHKKQQNHQLKRLIDSKSQCLDYGKQKQPYLQNLADDPVKNRKIKYLIDKQTTLIGRNLQKNSNCILIKGQRVRQKHAFIKKKENHLYLVPLDNSQCYLNGHIINQEKEIVNQDIICFGVRNYFLLQIPNIKPLKNVQQKTIDWKYAQKLLDKQAKEKMNFTDINTYQIRYKQIQNQIQESLQRICKDCRYLQQQLKVNIQLKESIKKQIMRIKIQEMKNQQKQNTKEKKKEKSRIEVSKQNKTIFQVCEKEKYEEKEKHEQIETKNIEVRRQKQYLKGIKRQFKARSSKSHS